MSRFEVSPCILSPESAHCDSFVLLRLINTIYVCMYVTKVECHQNSNRKVQNHVHVTYIENQTVTELY